MSEKSRRAAVSNAAVAERIGVNHSMVSRIRSGSRIPSIALMFTVEKTFGWDVAHQAGAAHTDIYAAEFENVLIQEYGAE